MFFNYQSVLIINVSDGFSGFDWCFETDMVGDLYTWPDHVENFAHFNLVFMLRVFEHEMSKQAFLLSPSQIL